MIRKIEKSIATPFGDLPMTIVVDPERQRISFGNPIRFSGTHEFGCRNGAVRVAAPALARRHEVMADGSGAKDVLTAVQRQVKGP